MSDESWPSDGWARAGGTSTWPSPPPGGLPQRTNGLAIASLVAGCAQFVCPFVAAILAIVFGHVARAQIRRSNGAEGGTGLATAGLILGYVGLVLTILASIGIGVVVFAFGDDIERSTLRGDARDFVEYAEFWSEDGDLRDPDVLRQAYRQLDLGGDYAMTLADGTAIPFADAGDWERVGWQAELSSDAFPQTAYVCLQIPEQAGAPPVIRNGRCPLAGQAPSSASSASSERTARGTARS